LSKFGFGLCCVGVGLGPDFLGPFDAPPDLKDFEGLLEPLLAPDLLGNAIVCSLFGEYVEVEIQKFRSYYIFEKYLGNDLFAPCDARKDVLGIRAP
jgi:hypothetical protein